MQLDAEREYAKLHRERLAMAQADCESNECRRWELAYVLTVSFQCGDTIEKARALDQAINSP